MSQPEISLAQQFAMLPEEERNNIIDSMPPQELAALSFDWNWWARPKQLKCFKEKDWSTFLYLCGRGFGKTRTGTEWVKYMAETYPGSYIAVVGPTTQSVNRTLVEGETGLLNICAPGSVTYQRTKAQVKWKNGSIAMLYSAEKPDRLRGPNHHFALADEVVAWKNPETWDMLKFTLRIGAKPQTLVTTTPKPTDLVLKIIGGLDNVGLVNSQDFIRFKKTVIVRGTTFENTALSEDAIEDYKDLYLDTAMGEQELFAKLLVNIQGALFKKEWIKHLNAYEDFLETDQIKKEPIYVKTVVAVDPATTASSNSDQTAICVASKGEDGRYYIRHCEGHQLSPQGWAEEVVRVYKKYNADKIIAEVNNGGDMVENTIRAVTRYKDNGKTYSIDGHSLPIEKIHAKKGKLLRAEEVALVYEQRRVTHIFTFADLEAQMVVFKGEPNGSDDLVDAMVYAMKDLLGSRLIEYNQPTVIGSGLVSSRFPTF